MQRKQAESADAMQQAIMSQRISDVMGNCEKQTIRIGRPEPLPPPEELEQLAVSSPLAIGIMGLFFMSKEQLEQISEDVKVMKEMLKWIKPDKIVCYVLVGFNSTPEQDYERLRYLKELGILPFVQPYRDFENKRKPTQYENDIARWANRRWLFNTQDFFDYRPRDGCRGSDYFSGDFVRKWGVPKTESVKVKEKVKEMDLFSKD